MKKFLVAQAVGGLAGMPGFKYYDHQIISANSPEDAVEIYNKKNNFSYFYGKCLGEYNEETGMVCVPISIFSIKD